MATLRKEGETDSQQLHWQLQDVGGGRGGRGGGGGTFHLLRSRALGGNREAASNWELLVEAAPFF